MAPVKFVVERALAQLDLKKVAKCLYAMAILHSLCHVHWESGLYPSGAVGADFYWCAVFGNDRVYLRQIKNLLCLMRDYALIR